MSMISRKDVRNAIKDGLIAAMSTAQVVYAYQRSKLGSVATAARLFSNGSYRPDIAEHGIRSELGFVVQLWALYGSETGEKPTEEQAEDNLDDMEYELAVWLSENNLSPGPLWQAAKISNIRPEGFSFVATQKIGAETYLVEDIPLIISVYG